MHERVITPFANRHFVMESGRLMETH
jgi:hypothetical protein